MMPFIALPEAQQELDEAIAFYEQRVPGLGLSFLSAVQAAFAEICEYPKSCPEVRGPIRRKLIRRFPYGVLFRVDEAEIVVIAIAHLRRRPGYWADRI
jgi:toxin ParE2